MIKFLIALLIALPVHAATVYKTIDANGKAVFSDQPPTSRKTETLKYTDAPYSPEPEYLKKFRKEIEAGLQNTEPKAVYTQATLFTTQWCGYCKQARQYMSTKGIPYREIDIETPSGAKALLATGIQGKGVPLLVLNNKNTQGFNAASYDHFFKGP